MARAQGRVLCSAAVYRGPEVSDKGANRLANNLWASRCGRVGGNLAAALLTCQPPQMRPCTPTPLDDSQHTLFPCVSRLPIKPRPLTLTPRVGIISRASRPAWQDAAEYQCVWAVGHVYQPTSSRPCLLQLFPGYRTRRSARCARQQQLHLLVI